MQIEKNLGIISPVPKGNWQSTTTYNSLNIVRHKRCSFLAKKSSLNIEPINNESWQDYWILLNADGNSIFVRYSTRSDGKYFTETWSQGQNYIGIGMGIGVEDAAPTDNSEYVWTRIADLVNVVQTTGTSTSAAMSQNAVSEIISNIEDVIAGLREDVNNFANYIKPAFHYITLVGNPYGNIFFSLFDDSGEEVHYDNIDKIIERLDGLGYIPASGFIPSESGEFLHVVALVAGTNSLYAYGMSVQNGYDEEVEITDKIDQVLDSMYGDIPTPMTMSLRLKR